MSLTHLFKKGAMSLVIASLLVAMFPFTASTVSAADHCSANKAPVPVIKQSKEHSEVDSKVHFSAHESYDPEGSDLKYLWAVNQLGIESTDPHFAFTPEDEGSYVVTLTVADECGFVATWTMLDVLAGPVCSEDNHAPKAVIEVDRGARFFDDVLYTVVGKTVELDADESRDRDGDRLQYLWAINDLGIEKRGEKFEFKPKKEGLYIITLTAGDRCDYDTTWVALYALSEIPR